MQQSIHTTAVRRLFGRAARFCVLIVLAGTTFMVTLGRRLLPDRPVHEKLRRAMLPQELFDLYRLPERVSALDIPSDSALVGRTLADSQLGYEFGLTVLEVIHRSGQRVVPGPSEVLHAHDRLLVQGGPRRLRSAAENWGLQVGEVADEDARLLAGDTGVVEVALAPRSPFVGRTLRELRFREKFGMTALALWRGGEPVERGIADEQLKLGDALLVFGPWRQIRLLRAEPGLLVLGDDEAVPRRTGKAPLAVAILLAMAAAVAAGIVPIVVAALAAALAVVLGGCLRIEEAHQAIEWRVIFLMAGVIPLGMAMEKSGAVELIAQAVIDLTGGSGVPLLIAVLLLLSALLSVVTINVTAAVLLAPLALSVAESFGLPSREALIAVALGASISFATPFAHQSNLLVMGPGSYRFSDYLRVGLPLSLVTFCAALVGLML